jgi:hypothetical protein
VLGEKETTVEQITKTPRIKCGRKVPMTMPRSSSEKLNVHEYSFNGAAANYGVHRILGSWDESLLTYLCSSGLFNVGGETVNFSSVDSYGNTLLLGANCTNSTGMAFWSLNYTGSGTAYAYKADIVPDYAGGSLRQGIVSSPVQLTVAKPTVLLLNVSRDNSSAAHLVEGWLMNGSQ